MHEDKATQSQGGIMGESARPSPPGVELRSPSTVRFLTGQVAVVRWQGYSFTISQVRWGGFRRWLYARVYHHVCPPSDVRFETAVFLAHADGRFNPQKPLHTTFQKSRDEARAMIRHLTEQVAEGRLAFQTFFQK